MLSKDQFFSPELTFAQSVQDQKNKMLDIYHNSTEKFTRAPFDLEKAFEYPGYVYTFGNHTLPPFRLACQQGFLELVQFLLIKNKDQCFSWTFMYGNTQEIIEEEVFSLREAIIYNQHSILAILLKAGFSPVKHDTREFDCPLAYAIKLNNTEAVKLLVEYGASLEDMTFHEYKHMTVREFIEVIKNDKSTTTFTRYNELSGKWDLSEDKPNYSLSTEMLELLQEMEINSSFQNLKL